MAPRPRLLLGGQPLYSGCSPCSFLLPGRRRHFRLHLPLRRDPLELRDTRPHFPKAGIGGLGGQGAGQKAWIGGMREGRSKGAETRRAIGGASGKGRYRGA